MLLYVYYTVSNVCKRTIIRISYYVLYMYIYLYTGDDRPHHKSNFDFDENALLISSSVLVQIARDLLA